MHLALPSIFVLTAALTSCSQDPAPADAAPPPARQAPVTAAPTAAPVAAAPAVPTSTPVRLALSGEGLDFVGNSGDVRHVVFGTAAAQVIDAVSRASAGVAPQRGRNDECGAGPLDMASWPHGLTVMSQEGRFVGWSVSRGAADGSNTGLATMAGIGFGSTRGQLEAAYAADIRETTLGQEFAAGDLFGVLDGTGPSARITALWAGTSCNFR